MANLCEAMKERRCHCQRSIDFSLPWNGGSQTVVRTAVTWKTHYKPILPGLTPRGFWFQWVWFKWTSRCAFLASSYVLLMLLIWDHTWRTIPLDKSQSAAVRKSSWFTVPAERWVEAAPGASLPELLAVVMVWIMHRHVSGGKLWVNTRFNSCVW